MELTSDCVELHDDNRVSDVSKIQNIARELAEEGRTNQDDGGNRTSN